MRNAQGDISIYVGVIHLSRHGFPNPTRTVWEGMAILRASNTNSTLEDTYVPGCRHLRTFHRKLDHVMQRIPSVQGSAVALSWTGKHCLVPGPTTRGRLGDHIELVAIPPMLDLPCRIGFRGEKHCTPLLAMAVLFTICSSSTTTAPILTTELQAAFSISCKRL